MGRVAKKAPEAANKSVEDSPPTITQTRAKRTPKPNPKYQNETVIATPKIESSAESNGSTDIESKLPETKIVKSIKKIVGKGTEESASATKNPAAAKGKGAIKKQKIEFDDDEKTKDADEIPLPSPRTTRSGKINETEIKIGNDSVEIVDVKNIIATAEDIKEESPKLTRGVGRKRQAADSVMPSDIVVKEESPKKKKEEEKTSLITARKSYIQTTLPAMKKIVPETKTIVEKTNATAIVKKIEPMEPSKQLANAIKTRRSVATPQTPEVEEKKAKIEVIKTSPRAIVPIEQRKLPVSAAKKEIITKVITPNPSPGLTTKITNAMQGGVGKPAPRILNTMVTPKGVKESPNVKLASDGTDRKVFSIEMSDGSVVEKRMISATALVKSPPVAAKENVATINKPQPALLLKNKLESELNRMKASASQVRRSVPLPTSRNVTNVTSSPIVRNATVVASPSAAQSAIQRRITKYESWYVIDVKNQETHAALKHSHNFSLIQMGNNIQEIEMPSNKWEYKITLQKRLPKSVSKEVYTGETTDACTEEDKHNYEPNTILFKRSQHDNSQRVNRVNIDRSLMFKSNMYGITMNGKNCHLLGAPSDIKSLEDVTTLLKIIDTCSLNHSCIEQNC